MKEKQKARTTKKSQNNPPQNKKGTGKDQKKSFSAKLAEWKKSKYFGICLISASALILFAVGIILIFSPQNKNPAPNTEFYPADYDENIFENAAYMSMDRDLLYRNGNYVKQYNYENDFNSATPECQFFLEYFNTVINGDYQSYKHYFYDDYYFQEDPMFTMQMIYDIEVAFGSVSKDEIDGKEIELINFEVKYRIFNNNKTFRSDVNSNLWVPQVYQLIQREDGTFKIFRIYNIEEKVS